MALPCKILAGPSGGDHSWILYNFGNKKVVNFRGFGVPTARPEGAKGRTGLGWVWNGHFRPPWGWLLGDLLYHRGPGAVCSELGIGEGITPE